MATSEANRGKSSEDDVKKYLEAYDRKTKAFDWHRNYDAHTAGGRFPRQVGDFEFYMPNCFGIIEVKETETVATLPFKNYKPEGVAKLRKRMWAGGRVFVLVHHTRHEVWRVSGIEPYIHREGKSWDVSGLPSYGSCKEALDSLRLFV